MNFADAIRMAAKNAEEHKAPQDAYSPPEFGHDKETQAMANEPAQPGFEPPAEPNFGGTDGDETGFDHAFDAVTAEPVPLPEGPNQSVRGGNVVRLELFLAPEQMNQLFRALVATQHGMLTLREAAQYLRVHPNTVEQMAQEGQIPALMIEGRWRFPKSSLDEWLSIQVFRKGESHAA